MERIVLAYSGGLDTSIMIPWLKENRRAEVIAVTIDLGQGEELAPLEAKSKESGAADLYIEDARDEFTHDFILPAVQAGALYEQSYLLGTALARPVIAKRLVEVAKRVGANAIAHGATGKGNDQVRFELGIRALAPELKIVAPWREWGIRSREMAIEYAESKNIPIPVTKSASYSRDRNLWHLSHEGVELEDPGNRPSEAVLQWVTPPHKAPDRTTELTIQFKSGIPIALDGKELQPRQLIETLNELGAANGIGIVDLVENRLVGMKSRGVYETPGGTILFRAHQELERLTLDRETAQTKLGLSHQYSRLIYDGFWFHPLREHLDQFMRSTQAHVSGTVHLQLYKGNCTLAGMTSPSSLYDQSLCTFEEGDGYNQKDAEGFIRILGLPLEVHSSKQRGRT